jgi:hypothetical protein
VRPLGFVMGGSDRASRLVPAMPRPYIIAHATAANVRQGDTKKRGAHAPLLTVCSDSRCAGLRAHQLEAQSQVGHLLLLFLLAKVNPLFFLVQHLDRQPERLQFLDQYPE